MKILWIAQEPTDDAVAVAMTARVNMRAALQHAGHEVPQVLGTGSGRSDHLQDGTEYWPSSTFVQKLLFNLRTVKRILSTDADVVVLHQEFQVAAGVVASTARFLRRVPPIVMDVRTLPVHATATLVQRLRWLRFRLSVRAASAFLAGVTTVTPTMTEFLVSRGWLKPAKLLGEFSSGVTLTPVPAHLPSDVAARLSQLPRPLGAYLGVLGENRGLEQLMQAVERPDFNGSLVLVGSGPIGAKLKSLPAADLPKVLFTGKLPQEQAWAVLRQCDYGICLLPDLPWWRVSSPLKVLEYLANGLPVLASSPVHQALLGEYSGALLIEDLQPAAISEATGMMTHVKPDDTQRMALLQRHSWTRVAEYFVAALEKASW